MSERYPREVYLLTAQAAEKAVRHYGDEYLLRFLLREVVGDVGRPGGAKLKSTATCGGT